MNREFPWNVEIYDRQLIVDNNNKSKVVYAYKRDMTIKGDTKTITWYDMNILDINDEYVINDIKNGRL